MIEPPANSDGEVELNLYRTMTRIRQFEEAAGRLIAAARIPGFVHLSIGQEAVAAGVCSALRQSDTITSTHRGHGHCIAKGGRVDRMMAELFGKAEGYCGGRSGSLHIADPSLGILGANGIVGAGIPIALGSALRASTLDCDDVAVAFFGEGAVPEGVFHESLNLAALWSLPMIFACENNQYAELSHVSLHVKAEHVADHGAPYGIPAATIDGNDVLAVREATLAAVDRARARLGPSLLEFETYRFRGHFEGDAQHYRDDDELQRWRARDPLSQLETVIVERLGISADRLREMDRDIQSEVVRAIAWAEALPDLGPECMTQSVYVEKSSEG